jgi:hypothetical protein
MDDGTNLLASMFAGTVGAALMVYGKKQSRVPHLVVGLAMIAYPYFMPNAWITCGVFAGLVGLLALAVRAGV